MEKLIRFFAERHKLAWMGTLLILGLGTSTLFTINRSQYPNVDMGQMVITTPYPGASAEDVELNVTNNIEDELKSVTGLKRVTSTSSENVSSIFVEIDANESDQQAVKDDVREAVGRVTDFPSEVTESPRIIDIKTAIFPIFEVGLAGDIPYGELREIARNFENKLEEVPGVSSIDRHGYLDREIKIEVIPEKLLEYQISIEEVINAIKARNIRVTGGTLESYTSEKNVVTLAQFRDPMEVKDVVIRSTYQGPLIKVGDVAEVRDDFEDARVRSRLGGKDAISFVVKKGENDDIIRTTDSIKALIKQQSEFLPDGVEFLTRYDISKNTRNQFEIVMKNGGFGLALVFLMLTIFLNWRVSIWVAMGIPVSALGTIFLLPIFGVSLDSITLTAMVIVVGIIVDDAIIITENISRHRENGESPVDAAVKGLGEVWMPVLTTILTTFLAFAPMFFMPGMMGKFVIVIPITVSLSLFISMAEGFFALPAHLGPGLKRHQGNQVKKGWDPFRGLVWLFRHVIGFVLKLRYLLVLFFVGLMISAIWYAKNYMSFVLFPTDGADRFYGRIELPTGSSLDATSDVMSQIEAIIEGLPEGEVASYGSRIGAFADLVDTEKENYATIMIDLTPFSQRTRTADEIVEEVRAKASAIKDVRTINFEIDAGGPPTGRPVTIRVVGTDDDVRTQLADAVVAKLELIEGVKDIDRDDKTGKEQVEIIIDYERLARVGLTVARIANNVRIAFDGEAVTSVRYGHEDVEFRVTLPFEKRQDLESLYSWPIPNAQGRLIELGSVGRVEVGPGPSSFHHYEGERTITVTADVDQKVVTAQQATLGAIDGFNLDVEFPGFRLIAGGETEETMESMKGLIIAFIFGIIGIYFLLVLLFDSFSQPFLVLLAVPFGLIGVILAFGLHNETLSFLAMIGTVGLVGVVVNDSLVLVDRINRMRRADPHIPVFKLVVEGTCRRFRPIILTTLTTISGLLPLAYGLGGADTYMGPMALALGYGILFATPLTLGLIPCLYMISHDLGQLLRGKRRD